MGNPQRHVLVCLNTRPPGNPKGSCGEKGSESVFEGLKAFVRDQGLSDRIIVNRTNCLKHCSRGITVTVYPENVWYGHVTPEDVETIGRDHLVDGGIVSRLLMPDIPWE